MKLAIIGSGPLAILCAHHFDQLGAEVVLFQKSPLGGSLRRQLKYNPKMEIEFIGETQTIQKFWDQSLVPKIEYLESRQLSKAGEVQRVHKRFLHNDEKIEGKSRLHDLFRVIFSVNPKEAILKQLEENPEMFKQLGEQVVNSLHAPVESFEDFDIVIDARGVGKMPMPMGAGNANALNEKNLKGTAPLYYQKDIFDVSLEDSKSIVLVGDTNSAGLALIKCNEWLFAHPENSLSWITHSSISKCFQNKWIASEVKKIINNAEKQFEEEKSIFETKIRQWRDLEDYIKVKVPKPIEPEKKLKIFEGYDVTSVDRLLDRQGVFVTIESPDFRSFASANDLLTLPADKIFVGCGVSSSSLFESGENISEPGFYKLEGELSTVIERIKEIEEKILAFFSRAE